MKIMVANYLEIQLRINEMCLISVNRRNDFVAYNISCTNPVFGNGL